MADRGASAACVGALPLVMRHAIADLTDLLASSGIEMAREEARDIIAAVLDVPRLWPSIHGDVEVDEKLMDEARMVAARRCRGMPFAYAVGRAAFRHLTLEVDQRVLIPRQETEVLVDEVLLVQANDLGVGGIAIDVGTGSGAIALSLAMEGRFERIIGTDVSLDALVVARSNAARLAHALRAPVELRCGSLLASVQGLRASVIVSNPPYVSHREASTLPASVRDWEPPVALFSGDDGLAATAALIRDAAPILEPGGLLAIEVDARRADASAALVREDGRYRDVVLRRDLAGRDRILLARRCAADRSPESHAG